MSDLESRLNKRYFALTDKILYFPCNSNKPTTEYPRYHNFQRKKTIKTTYIAVVGMSSYDIMEAMAESILGYEVVYSSLSSKDQKALYDKYEFLKKEYAHLFNRKPPI